MHNDVLAQALRGERMPTFASTAPTLLHSQVAAQVTKWDGAKGTMFREAGARVMGSEDMDWVPPERQNEIRIGALVASTRGEEKHKERKHVGLVHNYIQDDLPLPTGMALAKAVACERFLEESVGINHPKPFRYSDMVFGWSDEHSPIEDGPQIIINQPSCKEDYDRLFEDYFNRPGSRLYVVTGQAVYYPNTRKIHAGASIAYLGEITGRDEIVAAFKENVEHVGRRSAGLHTPDILKAGLVEPPSDVLLFYRTTPPIVLGLDEAENLLIDPDNAKRPPKLGLEEVGVIQLVPNDNDIGYMMGDTQRLEIQAAMADSPGYIDYPSIYEQAEQDGAVPVWLYPYHRELDVFGKWEVPYYVTNGGRWKASFAEKIGIPIMDDPNGEVRKRMAVFEHDYQEQLNMREKKGVLAGYHTDVVTEAFIDGAPTQLVLASEKLNGANTVLDSDGRTQNFFTTDSAYKATLPDGRAFIFQKADNEKEKIELLLFLQWLKEQKNVQLSNVVGIARLGEFIGSLEYFTVEQKLGQIQGFNTAVFWKNIHNPDYEKVSMGMPTTASYGFVVPESQTGKLEVEVTRFEFYTRATSHSGKKGYCPPPQIDYKRGDRIPLVPVGRAKFMMDDDNPELLLGVGVGFFGLDDTEHFQPV